MSSLSPDDPLRQLDLLGGVQERAPARFAQKELERVGARLVGAPVGGPLLLRLQSFDEFDPAPLQFAHQLLRLRRIELERRDDRVQLRPLHRATQLRALEQALHLLEAKGRLDLVRHGKRRFLEQPVLLAARGPIAKVLGRGLRDKEERRRSARFSPGVKDRLLAARDRHYSAPRARARAAEDISGVSRKLRRLADQLAPSRAGSSILARG